MGPLLLNNSLLTLVLPFSLNSENSNSIMMLTSQKQKKELTWWSNSFLCLYWGYTNTVISGVTFIVNQGPPLEHTFMALKDVLPVSILLPTPSTESPAQSGHPVNVYPIHFPVSIGLSQRNGGRRDLHWHSWQMWQGVRLKAVQRSTGANLISCCFGWHALPWPFSAWVLPQKGWWGKLFNAYIYYAVIYQNWYQ